MKVELHFSDVGFVQLPSNLRQIGVNVNRIRNCLLRKLGYAVYTWDYK